MSDSTGRQWLAVGSLSVALVVAHNVFVATHPSEVATITVNLLLAVALVGWAIRCGLGPRDLGMATSRHGWTVAAIAAAAVAVLVVAFTASGEAPADPQVAALASGQVWFRVLVAIPIGTAVCEEVIFRGVLLAAWSRLTGRGAATLVVSALFGAWHLAAEVLRTGQVGGAALPGVAATAAASALVLIPLRRRGGDLAAPVAVHALTNIGVFAAVAFAS